MSNGPKIEEKKKFKLPHIFVLLFCIVLLCTILTWIIPAGQFDRIVNDTGREIAVAGTWHKVDPTPVGFLGFFTSFYDGMLLAAEIMITVFIAFASVQFVLKSGAFDGLVVALMKVFKGKSSVIVIPIFMAIIGIASSTIGMFEEWLAFIPIFAAIFIGLGYDAMVGLAVVALGAGMGFSGATINPFTVGVAQGIAEVPYMSGVGFRLLCHAVMLIVGSGLTIRYALKVKADPTKSYVYGDDFSSIASTDSDVKAEFTWRQKVVLLDLFVAIGVIVWGVNKFGWYFAEITAIFMVMGLIAAFVMGFKPDQIAMVFQEGFKDACTAAMMVGIARATLIVLQEGNIIDTVVYYFSSPLAALPAWAAAVCMLLIQTMLNFFIPSGSGQAAVSMPIMAPTADLLGIPRDIAVLAYQFGDGMSNIVWPTAFAAIMAGLAGVKLEKWWKFIFPVFGCIIATQAVMIVIAMNTGFGV